MVSRISEATEDTPHLHELDGFRGLSILAVLAAHMLPLGPSEWLLNSASGYMGMSVFFCLSGFLITKFLWERQDIKVFLFRRAARIMPLVFVVSVFYAIFLERDLVSFAAINLYILNYWHAGINPSVSPLWSLGVEMHFYIFIAILVLFWGRPGLLFIPVAAAIVTANRVESEIFGAIATHVRVDEILAGSMLALFFLNRDNHFLAAIWKRLPFSFWIFFPLWVLSCWPPSEALGYLRPYLTAAMMGSVLSMNGGWQKDVLSHRALRYIALISFALYVWHSPFRSYWFAAGTDFQVYMIKRPIGILLTFLLAHLSTFYFEQRITQWMRSQTKLTNA